MRIRVQWYETSAVPGNFGWCDGRQKIVKSLVVAEIMAAAMMKDRENRVTVDLLKDEGGGIGLGERVRNEPIHWTKRGEQMLKEEKARIAEHGDLLS